MNDDLIKRSDAIEALGEEPYVWTDDDEFAQGERSQWIDDVSAIKAVPSADRLQGEWIFKTVFPNDKSEFPMGYLVCSVCGSHHSNSTPCNYCDNCGARMREEEGVAEKPNSLVVFMMLQGWLNEEKIIRDLTED